MKANNEMSDASNKPSKPSFWKRDIDPFPTWRSGEFIEPEPDARKKYLLRTVIPCLLLAAALVCAEPFIAIWLRDFGSSLTELAKTNPALAAEKGATMLRWLSSGMSLVGCITAVYLLISAAREWRAGRSPLPGAVVLRRTEIIRGKLLKLRVAVAVFGGFIVLALCLYCTILMHQLADEQVARYSGRPVDSAERSSVR